MTDLSPQEQVARQFMEHKGYLNVEPTEIDELDGTPCWYFLYELPEGSLELEVFWNGREWETTVTTFTLAD